MDFQVTMNFNNYAFKVTLCVCVALLSSVVSAQSFSTSLTSESAGQFQGARNAPVYEISEGLKKPLIGNLPSVLADSDAAEWSRAKTRPAVRPSDDNVIKRTKTSQFQRFVEESTGQLLRHYGFELFEKQDVFDADPMVSPSADYKVGVGDEVRVQLWGSVDYAGSHTIDRNGQIFIPKIGVIPLAGTAVKDLDLQLRRSISTVFNHVNVSSSLGRLRGITVYVVGHARQPGTYTLSSLGSLVTALFASGGPDSSGSMRGIELKREGKVISILDLYDFISKGDKANDLPLRSGDVIVIPPAGPRVAVTGAWDHSGIYEIKPGQALRDILVIGGGVPKLANAQKAMIERIQVGRSPARSVQDVALDSAGLQLPLQDGDVVTLLPISPAFENAVTLHGAVAQPLRHPWTAGMRIQDLIPDREALITADYYKRQNRKIQNLTEASELQEAPTELKAPAEKSANMTASSPSEKSKRYPAQDRLKGMTDQVNWEYAVIERLNKSQLRTELIPFNLGKAIWQKDPANNLLLQPGDVVTIMSSRDLKLPTEQQNRMVRVEGEVVAPGVYQALPGETLPQLMRRIGGVTAQAYIFGAEFTREGVRKQQQLSLDTVVRRLESQLAGTGSANLANLTGERATQAATVQQAQQQQVRTQLDRLKNMKSTGRVALELSPDLVKSAAVSSEARISLLPSLPLEDGDAIWIPTQPAFVSAAGSVNNENVLIYKPGKTIGDVIRSAGLTEDAEPNEAFLLRADGSIVGRRSSGFLQSFENMEVMPGDTVVVPAMLDRESRYNFVIRAFKDWTQILSNFGLGVASLRVIKSGF